MRSRAVDKRFYLPPAGEGGNRAGGGGHERLVGGKPSNRQVSAFPNNKKAENCIKAKRKPENRYNVEVKLPGAGCASTVVATNKADTERKLREAARSNPLGACPLKVSIARHCVYGPHNPMGRPIQMKLGGAWVEARVTDVLSVDGNHGEPVADNNSDLSFMMATVPCGAAQYANVSQLPNPNELEELTRLTNERGNRPEMPIVMEQNDPLNARTLRDDGSVTKNAGSIVAMANFETTGGKLGDFATFNSLNDTYNKHDDPQLDLGRWQGSKQPIFDSPRIKSGDSGGFAGYCIFERGTDIVASIRYFGAISNIEVTGNNYEGQVGGVSSGKNLGDLISLVKAFERARPIPETTDQLSLAAGTAQSEDDHGKSAAGRPEAKP